MIGQTLPPIEGNPESVRALSRTLRSGAARLSSINAVIVGIKAGAQWDSPAGELFESAVQQSPPVLDALIKRYSVGAMALLAFSEELEGAQARARAASSRYNAATEVYFALEDLLVPAMGTPEQAPLEIRLAHARAAMASAESDHRAACEAFTRADHLLARQLRHLADDVLDDGVLYTALAKMDEFSQEVSCLSAVPRQVPVLGQAAMAGDIAGGVSGVGLLLLYGEGSWKEQGVNAAARGAGVGAKGLKTGSLAGSRSVSQLTTGKRAYVGEKLSTRERFFIGTREELHKKYPNLGKVLDGQVPQSRMVVPLKSVAPMMSTKGLPLSNKVQVWRAQGVAVTQHQAEKRFLDPWRAISAGGPNAQRMFVAGSTLERAVPKIQQGANNTLVEKPEEKVSAPTYP